MRSNNVALNSFLSAVASHVLKEYGSVLEKTAFIFPNRRAVQVFKSHLIRLTDKPIWAPKLASIDDWLSQMSGLVQADSITQLFSLYQAVKKKTGDKENLDNFIRWGEMLLKDFDETDKYLVDQHKLFRTITSVKEIDTQFPSLSPEQIEQLKKFWDGFHPSPSTFQEKWLELWQSLEIIYNNFHDNLSKLNLATGGQVYRKSFEKISLDPAGSLNLDKYFFIGFNALTTVEERIFEICLREGKAEFYWDIPDNLMEGYQESGHFIRGHLRKFPPPGSFNKENHGLADRFGKKFPAGFESINIYACESASGQVAVLRQLLRADQIIANQQLHDRQKAVILSDESLLEPVLSAISNPETRINISMGFPADRSMIFDFVRRMIELNTNVPSQRAENFFISTGDLNQLINHPLFTVLMGEDFGDGLNFIEEWPASMMPLNLLLSKNPEIVQLFCYQDVNVLIDNLMKMFERYSVSSIEKNALEKESFGRIHLWITAIKEGLGSFKLKIKLDSFYFLFQDFIKKERLSFEGSLGAEIQLTGILETRLMDYDELIILSCNEGMWPADSSSTSLIPYNLRKAYNLPTREFSDSFYGYYFYRLLQRARKVSLMYVNSPDPSKISQGEPSRFIQQLRFDSGHPCIENISASQINPGVSPLRIVHKTGVVQETLQSYLDENGKKYLSPSALNTYIDCPLRFAFQYILKIREKDDLVEAGDPRMFGKLVHKTLEYFYQDFSDKDIFVTSDYLKEILGNKDKLSEYVRRAFLSEYFKLPPDSTWPGLYGKDLLVEQVLSKQFRSVLLVDQLYAPFKIVGLEKKLIQSIGFSLNGSEQKVKLGGIIDRIDEKDGCVRILDYKSGSPEMKFREISDLVDPLRTKRPKEIFQALVYSYLLKNDRSDGKVIAPVIYPTGKMRSKAFNPSIFHDKAELLDIGDYEKDIDELLQNLLAQIFNPKEAFKQTDNEDSCVYCSFKDYCQR